MKHHQLSWPAVLALGLLLLHVCIIANDVQQVIQDPNQANKPRELFKLAFDLSRYLH